MSKRRWAPPVAPPSDKASSLGARARARRVGTRGTCRCTSEPRGHEYGSRKLVQNKEPTEQKRENAVSRSASGWANSVAGDKKETGWWTHLQSGAARRGGAAAASALVVDAALQQPPRAKHTIPAPHRAHSTHCTAPGNTETMPPPAHSTAHTAVCSWLSREGWSAAPGQGRVARAPLRRLPAAAATNGSPGGAKGLRAVGLSVELRNPTARKKQAPAAPRASHRSRLLGLTVQTKLLSLTLAAFSPHGGGGGGTPPWREPGRGTQTGFFANERRAVPPFFMRPFKRANGEPLLGIE